MEKAVRFVEFILSLIANVLGVGADFLMACVNSIGPIPTALLACLLVLLLFATGKALQYLNDYLLAIFRQ